MAASKSTRRRTSVAFAIVMVLVFMLVYKLFSIQVVNAGTLNAQAAEKRGTVSKVYAPRGDIVSDDGTVLAGSVLRYDFIASPMNSVKSFKRTASSGAVTEVTREEAMGELSAITGSPATGYLAQLDNALKANPNSQYALLVQSVDVPVFDKIQALKIPWLTPVSHPARTYPDGSVGGNVVGYINSEGIGAEGLEQEYQKCLNGTDGQERYLLSEDGVTIPGSTKVVKEAKPGGTLETTLNSDLTWFANQQLAQTVPSLGAQFGQVTVLDVKTGQIKAAAQYPSVDPNNVDGVDPAYRSTAMLFSNQYEPGSTFKVLTAAAMVDTGYATPNTRVVAPYEFKSGNGADLYDSEVHGPENLTLTGVLMNSSNTGISIIGRNMSDQVRYDYYQKFGIGSPTGIGFPAESSGLLTAPKKWDDQTKYATMFGQGLAATQAQMLGAYETIANGGVKIPLSIVKGCKQADGTMTDVPKKSSTRVLKDSTTQTVMDMMESVAQQGPISSLIKIPGYRIAAKTGTAQESDGHGGYLPNYYVSVMGIFPVDDPQYIVSVNIGYPTTIRTSAAAAPLFKTITSQVLKTFHVSPSTSAPTMLPPTY